MLNFFFSIFHLGGGLDGAIRAAAGEGLNKETAELRGKHGPLRDGACVITGAYQITSARGRFWPSKHNNLYIVLYILAIIHSAAPDLRNQGNRSDATSESNLYACYYNAFRTAERYKMKSIVGFTWKMP